MNPRSLFELCWILWAQIDVLVSFPSCCSVSEIPPTNYILREIRCKCGRTLNPQQFTGTISVSSPSACFEYTRCKLRHPLAARHANPQVGPVQNELVVKTDEKQKGQITNRRSSWMQNQERMEVVWMQQQPGNTHVWRRCGKLKWRCVSFFLWGIRERIALWVNIAHRKQCFKAR